MDPTVDPVVEAPVQDTNQRKCEMMGCSMPVYRSLAIAPATVVGLCAQHFAEEGGTEEDGAAA